MRLPQPRLQQLSSSVRRARLLPNRPHSIKLGASLSRRIRCWCCSPPPEWENSSAVVGKPQWTRGGGPCIPIPVSPIRDSNVSKNNIVPYKQDEGLPAGSNLLNFLPRRTKHLACGGATNTV